MASFRVYDRVKVESVKYPIGEFTVMQVAGVMGGNQKLTIAEKIVESADPDIKITLLQRGICSKGDVIMGDVIMVDYDDGTIPYFGIVQKLTDAEVTIETHEGLINLELVRGSDKAIGSITVLRTAD